MAYAGGTSTSAFAQAISASSSIIIVDPGNFLKIITKAGKALVVMGRGGVFKSHFQYMTDYKGFKIFTKSGTELILPNDTEIISVKTIWVPGIYQGGTYWGNNYW